MDIRLCGAQVDWPMTLPSTSILRPLPVLLCPIHYRSVAVGSTWVHTFNHVRIIAENRAALQINYVHETK
jgi:hypothetical protein